MSRKRRTDSPVAGWLKSQLQRVGLTPADLAEKITASGYKIGRSIMYFYVNGDRLPSPEVMAQIEKALGAKAPEYKPRTVGRPKKIKRPVRDLIR